MVQRNKNFLVPIRPSRPPTSHFLFSLLLPLFFLFSFFLRIFRFEDSKRGCKRATRDSEQRTPARNGIRPLRIELINRISREYRLPRDPSRRGIPLRICFLCTLFASFHPYLDFYLFCSSFELTVPESHRTRFPSRRGHRCALERFLNVFDLLRIQIRNLNFNSLN